ncbi:malate dehydrogenase [Methanomicrobium sp. W14]|uniref:malate dehydrogenase n=1 Tax=Methanomicrobium sp. W14 TaxID=2817839 RepID=UPI001AE8456F|nr:malate dehydrogenase [Methanomicrobium sp. W14]MBP2133441.1 malate dehydrogenase [Methanomicrobium sp. W14]
MAKVTIIGASGKVGQFAAYSVSRIPFVTRMVLFGRDGNENVLEGTKWDFIDSFAALGRSLRLQWSIDPADIQDSDIVIITAGIPRHNGQTRLDLAKKNAVIIAGYAEMIAKNAPDSIILVVTNPVDVMTAVALKYSGFPQNRVFGLGTHLDSMRLKSFVANHFQVHVSEVHTRIIGEHGDSMVPLWSATTIGGIQVKNLLAFASLPKEEMVHWVKTAGSHIIEKSGATIYGPGAAIATLVRTVLGNENRILSVSAYVKSEVHDIGNVCIGVPARLNSHGAFPVSIRIDESEVRQFQQSVEKIRGVTAEVMEDLKNQMQDKENETN